MAKFISGSDLNSIIEKIFKNSESTIIIVSPFIKLHSRIVDILKSKKDNDKLKIQIVFGKNENEISKSLNEENFTFLKDFPNVIIKYESRLHAKYYANESHSILSSMNLYDYSQNNNIEFGIYTSAASFLDEIKGNTLDNEAFEYFQEVIKNSKTLFEKIPQYEKANFGLTKKYSCSEVIIDKLSEVFNKPQKNKPNSSKTKPFVREIGYCIRTGERINFNPDRPFSNRAFQTWSQFGNPDYEENYCHFSGESSNGDTSYNKPILRKNWRDAQKYSNF